MRINKSICIPLAAGFVIQIFTAWNSFFYHSDEYFQIIEFAAHKYHIAPLAPLTWEFTDKIRPSLQVHFFGIFYNCLTVIGIKDRFVILSLLSTLTGVVFFIVSNYLIVDKFKNKGFLVKLLWINNFFWVIPYLRCRYSSEITAALLWIAGIIIFEKLSHKTLNVITAGFLFLNGVVFSLSFYCRFQMLFAFAGLPIWFFALPKKKFTNAVILCIGFFIGIAFNILLDKMYYGEWVFTPYRYFYYNIIEGKANSFGTSPWWRYLIILVFVGIPLAGVALFAFFVKGLTLYKNPFALGTFFFIAAHSVIGHKEERFLFPVVLIMVYLAAEAYDKFPSMAAKAKAAWNYPYIGWFIRATFYFSVASNIFLVILLAVETYKQPIMFIKNLNEKLSGNEEVISFRQHPYETESGLRYSFLSQDKCDNCIRVISDKETFIKVLQQHPYFKYCILLADARKNKWEYLLENKNAIVASSFTWRIGSWLATNLDIIIPDLWICQTYDEVGRNKYVPISLSRNSITHNK